MYAVQGFELVWLEHILQCSASPEDKQQGQNREVPLHSELKHRDDSQQHSTCSPHSLPPHALRLVRAVQEAKVLPEAVAVSLAPAGVQPHTHSCRDNDAPEDNGGQAQA